MKLYTLFASLDGRPVLVVGGGAVAARKVNALLDTGAILGIAATRLTGELQRLVEAGRIRWLPGAFRDEWLDDAWLVVIATDDRAFNARVASTAGRRRILANVVDDPALSSFHVPAVVDRAPLMLAISSGGQAPMLARRLRERLEALIDHSWGSLTALAQRHRGRIQRRYPELARRRRFYDWLHDGPVAALLRRQRPAAAEAALRHALARTGETPDRGSVALVGAGPGDPGLLTLNALRALYTADVILHDRLVGDAVLALARRDAERVDVGKRPGEDHEATQARIHALMREHARRGRRVVRLKGGDAFIFGRGGEELAFLRAHDVAYEVVPGITAAIACAAYAGVPLTHRDHAQSVHLVTAHCKASLDTLDWRALAAGRQTLAIYMGIAQLATLTRRLLEHGRASSTPFALVENGSRPEQRVVHGRLEQLPRLATLHAVRPPALLIIGEVAGLAGELAWFGAQASADDPRVRAA